jgi:rsbT co-antagonist protein RsbR
MEAAHRCFPGGATMGTTADHGLADTILQNEGELLPEWVRRQLASVTSRRDLIRDEELREQSSQFLNRFTRALKAGASDDVMSDAWGETRALLEQVSGSRARQGFRPSETAMFVFSLRQPLFDLLRRENTTDPERLTADLLTTTTVIDRLGLFTVETYQKGREEMIVRQQQEMLELSTPVVQLWDGILALPLIGTLDSARTQTVMENLLEKIVETGSEVAILDITGVPTVDTLVAQHLMKAVAAARLMGAECIISGIRPQIAQTIVHLGVDLADVTTKASLADAFKHALQRNGLMIAPASAQKA